MATKKSALGIAAEEFCRNMIDCQRDYALCTSSFDPIFLLPMRYKEDFKAGALWLLEKAKNAGLGGDNLIEDLEALCK